MQKQNSYTLLFYDILEYIQYDICNSIRHVLYSDYPLVVTTFVIENGLQNLYYFNIGGFSFFTFLCLGQPTACPIPQQRWGFYILGQLIKT